MPQQEVVIPQKVEEKVLLSWNAPARPFKTRSRDFYVTAIAMSLVFGLILFIVEGFMPVLLLIALLFLFYVLSTVEPENIEYQITNFGIKIDRSTTEWNSLGRFWFASRFGSELLILEAANLTGRMELVIDSTKKQAIQTELEKHLTHEEIPPSYLDKAANWLTKKLPDY